jgi:hypothetical protein
MTTEADPKLEASGQKQQEPDYAGFKTPEELVSAYTEKSEKMESLQKQVSDLERIKGDNSGQISQLRHQIATLSGQIEGMKSIAPSHQQQGPTLEDITADLESGKINESEALRMAVKITEQNVKNALTQQYKSDFKNELDAFKADLGRQQHIQKFISDNPGYVEAFEAGELDQWLVTDPVTGEKTGGENAWREYKLHTAQAKVKKLEEEAEKKKANAEKAGIDKGLELAQAKSSAAKVLDGKGGQFSQVSGNYDLTNARQRAQAGHAYLQKMRSGGG